MTGRKQTKLSWVVFGVRNFWVGLVCGFGTGSSTKGPRVASGMGGLFGVESVEPKLPWAVRSPDPCPAPEHFVSEVDVLAS